MGNKGNRKRCFGLWALLWGFLFLPMQAQEADSLFASVLTCSPGNENYSLYGHTALRIGNRNQHQDWAFNYGVFSFDKPNFAWRFTLGETDYTVEAIPTFYFISHYQEQKRIVCEQELNLTQEEILHMLEQMGENLKDPNWTYRYNFLSDNCTSRVVNLVRNSLQGQFLLPKQEQKVTFRQIIHEFAAESSAWDAFGQDLMLGADVDTAVSVEAQLAFPLYAERLLDSIVIVRTDGVRQPLVKNKKFFPQGTTTTYVLAPASGWGKFFPPIVAALFMLLLALFVSRRQWKEGKDRAANIFDNTALLVHGLAGCLIFILFFFSEHPAVGSNWLVLGLNPLPLVALFFRLLRKSKGRADRYIAFVQPVLVLLIFLAAFMQKTPWALNVLALSLIIRSLTHRKLFQREKKTKAVNTEK